MPHKDKHRDEARKSGTYDVYIDIDCEPLLDCCGLDYTRSEEDATQNVVKIILDKDDFCDVFETCQLVTPSLEQEFSTRLLNAELGEYTTKVTVYTPHGDKITFE